MKLALAAAAMAAMLHSGLATPIDWFGTDAKETPSYCDADQGHSNAPFSYNGQSQGKSTDISHFILQYSQYAQACKS